VVNNGYKHSKNAKLTAPSSYEMLFLAEIHDKRKITSEPEPVGFQNYQDFHGNPLYGIEISYDVIRSRKSLKNSK